MTPKDPEFPAAEDSETVVESFTGVETTASRKVGDWDAPENDPERAVVVGLSVKELEGNKSEETVLNKWENQT